MKDYDNVYQVYRDLVQIFRLIPDYRMEPDVLPMWQTVTLAVHGAILKVQDAIFDDPNDGTLWDAWSRDLDVSDV